MAALYGTMLGNRGAVTRMGSKDSGIRSILQTWTGAIRTVLEHDGSARVEIGSPDGESWTVVWVGSVDEGGDRV